MKKSKGNRPSGYRTVKWLAKTIKAVQDNNNDFIIVFTGYAGVGKTDQERPVPGVPHDAVDQPHVSPVHAQYPGATQTFHAVSVAVSGYCAVLQNEIGPPICNDDIRHEDRIVGEEAVDARDS